MSDIQHGLSREEYLELRAPYLPEDRLGIGVATEVRLYFYNSEGRVSEPLFSAMMKDIIGIKPSSKDEGLRID